MADCLYIMVTQGHLFNLVVHIFDLGGVCIVQESFVPSVKSARVFIFHFYQVFLLILSELLY